MAKFAFTINGVYHEVGSFETPVHAAHFLRQHHAGKEIVHVEMRKPEPVGPVKEDKTPHSASTPVPTPDVNTDEPASTSSTIAN